MLYFDHSATTPLHPDVKKLFIETVDFFGNPSSVHSYGRKAKALLETARRQLASAINCEAQEIIFTGGGTEANSMVLWNLLHDEKKHVVTSAIEHPAILKTLDELSEFGMTYKTIGVDSHGEINPRDVERAIQKNTGLITIMLANNEMGAIQPIEELSDIANNHGIMMHTDAVQALGKIQINVKELGVDCMSFSAHKFYGPKGVGALYIGKGNHIKPLIIGGSQEMSLRAGTENVMGIAGMGLAGELATINVENNARYLKNLMRLFKNGLNEIYPDAIYHSKSDNSLPGLISVAFPGYGSDILMAKLDRLGVCVSSGSACGSGDVKPSRILTEMGVDDALNISTLRISFGMGNTEEEVRILVNALKSALANK